jgi:hypothetical protein
MLFLPQNVEILLLLAVVIFLLRRAVRRPQKDANLWLPVIAVVVSVPISVLSWQIMQQASINSSPGGIVFGLIFGVFSFVIVLAVLTLIMRLLVRSGVLKSRDELPRRTTPFHRRWWVWLLAAVFGFYLLVIVGRSLLVFLDETTQAFQQRRAQRSDIAEPPEATPPVIAPTEEPEPPPPLVLSITSDTDVSEVGQPILITLTLRNISQNAVSVFTRSFTPPLPLLERGTCDVYGSNGERIRVGTPRQPLPAREAEFTVLEPGENLSYRLNLDDAPMEILEPDVYTVTCCYYGTDRYYENGVPTTVAHPWVGEVASNVETIQVVPQTP